MSIVEKKYKILLVENNILFKQLYCLNIEMYLGIKEIHVVDSAKDAIEYLSQFNDIDIILTKNTLKTENTSKDLESFFETINKKIPLVIIGKRDMFSFGSSCIEKSLNIKKILKVLSGLLKITAEDMIKKPVDTYIDFPIDYLQNIYWTNVDFYTKDKNGFVKLVEKDSKIDFEKLDSKDSKLYLYHLNRLSFANHFSSEIISQLSADEISTKEQLLLAEVLSDETAVRISKFGIEIGTIEQSKKAQEMITNIGNSNKSVKSLISSLMENKDSYRFRHMQVCSFLSLHILKQMDWSNEEQEKKISFVSFYQNILLTKDEHVKINSKEELAEAKLSEADRQLVLNHAHKASELVLSIPKIPMGVDTIIKHQHGTLNGIGFTDVYGGSLSPLSLIFIIAEQFAHIILREDEKFDYERSLAEIKSKFPTKRFEKIILSLNVKKNNLKKK